MKKLVCAVVAASPVLAMGQIIEVTTDRSVVDLSVPGGNEVIISITIDRQGYAEGPWADWNGWLLLEGYLVGNGGRFQLPIESDADENGGAWEGRRPPSIAGQGNGANGGFRFTTWGNGYLEGSGSETWAGNVAVGDSVRQWDSVLGLESSNPSKYGQSLAMDQAWPVLGGFNQDLGDRVEIFRARMVFDTPGVHVISFVPADIAFWDNPELTHATIGLEEVLSVMSIEVATVEARIPTPATLALLGAIPFVRRRR